MKINVNVQIKICPLCRKAYHGVPALSRKDNKTHICQDCGTREALDGIGVKASEQDEILKIIHKYMNK